MQTQKPNIPGHYLWEYDLETFNYDKSYKIVFERILERGTIEDWKEIIRYYGLDKIHEVIAWSKQLRQREKDFARFFLQSNLLDVT